MKGRQILIESLPAGGHAAALLVDGKLEDLLIDPPPGADPVLPEAIFLARVGRPLKRLGGGFVDLGAGLHGFLRGARLPPQGTAVLVEVSAVAEPGKAPPVSTRVGLRGRTALLTPGAPGCNVSRAVRDPARRASLETLGTTALTGADPELGLILRTAAEDASETEIAEEIGALRADWEALDIGGNQPGLRRPAPGARALALRDWRDVPTPVLENAGSLADAGVWEDVDALHRPEVDLDAGSMTVEPTRALVAIDVNTRGETGGAAALRANIAAARELPKQLRLRGLGGQVVVDFAPLTKADRGRIEAVLTGALRRDGIETSILGWTPLGHLELRRKRARRPLGN